MASPKNLWPIIGIFLLLALVACGSVNAATQTSQGKTTHSAAIQINICKQSTPIPQSSPNVKPSVSSSSTGNNNSSAPPTAQAQQLALYVFGLINHDRVAVGLPAYRWSNALSRGAHLHNLRMMAYGQLSHQCPDELGLGRRISNDGIAWRSASENIGWSNYPDPKQGVLSNHQSMMAEKSPDDGHRQNILSTSFNLAGIDVLVDAHHNVWITEDFAQA